MVAADPVDAGLIVALRDSRLGEGAGVFLTEIVDSVLIGSAWDALELLPAEGVRDAVMVDPTTRTARALLSDAGVRAYGLWLPDGLSLSTWLRPFDRDTAAVRLADAILASTPPPRGLAEEVTAR